MKAKIFLSLFWVLCVVSPLSRSFAATAEDVVKAIANLPSSERKAYLEKGARQEGTLVWYSNVSQADLPKLLANFEKLYPYIKVEFWRASGNRVFTRVESEARAGRHATDVVGTQAANTWLLKERGFSTAYLSPEDKGLPRGSYDPKGYWAAFDVTPLVLAYNTNAVSGADVPTSYEDLLLPKWKGNMSLGTEDYEWFSVLLDSMGEEKGLEYMRALAKQNLQMPGAGSRMRVELMIAGESAMAIAARSRRVVEFKEKGAPTDFRILEPYVGDPNFVSLMKDSPHPHAAILFIDWILSASGQTALAEVPRIPVRKGIKPIGSLEPLVEKDFVFVRPEVIGGELNKIIDEYNKIFGLQ